MFCVFLDSCSPSHNWTTFALIYTPYWTPCNNFRQLWYLSIPGWKEIRRKLHVVVLSSEDMARFKRAVKEISEPRCVCRRCNHMKLCLQLKIITWWLEDLRDPKNAGTTVIRAIILLVHTYRLVPAKLQTKRKQFCGCSEMKRLNKSSLLTIKLQRLMCQVHYAPSAEN